MDQLGSPAENAGLVSLIFPTYNPGAELEETWPLVRQFLEQTPGAWEVLYVCDGCSDGTPERLEELTANEDRVRVISYRPNQGKGHAVRVGLEAARGQWRIFTDVDLSYELDGVRRVLAKLQADADVVIGSRAHPESSFLVPLHLQDYAFKRRIQSWGFTTLVQTLLPLKCGDTQGGLKGFSARAVQTILPHLQCDGFAFDCELLLACQHCRLEVVEVPVCFHYRDTTTTNLRKTIKMVRDLMTIGRRFRQGPPVEKPQASQREHWWQSWRPWSKSSKQPDSHQVPDSNEQAMTASR